ncbi:CubicO group peptidase (beta-lactamase class C family) [Sphingopyxis panaciterrae]|uniref:serine hydrolase domain-containing protein n=1 Tax=Sphingopyxis panaciterrae TaxID=363841 RepID=UPI0014246916|nr:serine hydrolase domain-containing protein [Sphingopyxis panaciterrae]NIJ38462.1 CubicO group peptidase (beta-lactamase class C family) [Sphingopyxis panaciterrae]
MFGLTKTLCAAAMLCVAGPALAAPDAATFNTQLDAFVEQEMGAEKVPGVSVAVLHKGEIIVAKGYGLANVEHDVPVTPETIFQSGSVGKMFTAAVVMRQVEQGKMSLDDPLSKYVPDAPASWRPITIRHLLTHTSGIPNVGDDFDFQRNYSDDELIRGFAALPLSFQPGARYSYSNSGYVLLGIVVERATGRFYGDILKTDIFQPLGMKTARVISDKDIVPHRAAGYELVDGVLKNQDFVSVKMNTTADGSLYVSLDDMIAWARGVEQGKVLSAASWKQVYTPVRLNSGKTYPYGFGWDVDVAGGKPRLHHGGSWQGFRSYYSRYLGDDLVILFLANSAEANTETFVDGIAKLWDPALVAVPSPKPEPDVARRVTALIETARVGGLRPQDVPLAPATFITTQSPYFVKDLKELGALTKLELIERGEAGDDINYVFKATFGERVARVYYSVAPGNQASNFFLSL